MLFKKTKAPASQCHIDKNYTNLSMKKEYNKISQTVKSVYFWHIKLVKFYSEFPFLFKHI